MQGQLREALFNIIGDSIQDASVQDLFSGTGSIGFEALSRGAASCAFFEHNHQAVGVLYRNRETLGFEPVSKIFKTNLLKNSAVPVSGFEPYDFVFLDPPFSFHDHEAKRDIDLLVHCMGEACFFSDNVMIIMQIRKKQNAPSTLGPLSLVDLREYGSVSLTFYKKA